MIGGVRLRSTGPLQFHLCITMRVAPGENLIILQEPHFTYRCLMPNRTDN
jgi:hypothetical protein